MMTKQLQSIKEKLDTASQLPRKTEQDYLREKDTRNFHRFFGADTHGFRLNPLLSSSQTAEWERQFQVTLPTAYRAFLEHIGNGGAGPYYGLFPLEQWGRGCNVEDAEALEAWASAPCVLRERYAVSDDPKAWLREVGGVEWEKRFNAGVWSPLMGTLTLCEVGCGGYFYLILNGDLTGHVCFAEHLTQPTVYPHENFLVWHEGWLDYVLTGKSNTFHP